MPSSLWPDPATVLKSPTPSSAPSSSSLFPDPEKLIGKPAPVKAQAPNTAASIPQVPQGTAKNFMSGLGDAFGQVVHYAVGSGSLPAQFIKPFTKPSQQEQQIENNVTGPTGNKVSDIISAVPRGLAKVVVRGLEPLAEGLGNQIATIQFDKETAKSLAENKQVQTIGKQAPPQTSQKLDTSKLTPEDYVSTVMNSANVALPIAGAITDFFGMAGTKLATKGTDLHVTPDQIGEVLKSDTPMPAEARMVLEHLKENGQGFDLNLKRPAGGLRQTVGEALGGTPERATTFQPTGDVNPQIDSGRVEPFAHENAPQALSLTQEGQEIQPFGHEPTIPEPRIKPFSESLAGAVGGGQGITLYRGGSTFQPAKVTSEGASFTTSPDIAGKFDNMAKGKGGTGKLEQFTLDSNAKILDVSKLTPAVLKTELNESNILKYAKDNGYDAIDFRNGPKEWLHNQEQEIRVINPDIIQNQQTYKPSTSTTLHAELVPGLSKTIEEDIIPKAKGGIQRVQDIYHEISAMVNPTGAAPGEAVDILMKNKGDYEKKIFRTEQTQKVISKAWDKQPEENRLVFMEKIETGQFIEGENKALADSYRERLNNAYRVITKYKEGLNFLENYFPHFWQKPDQIAKDFIPEIMARRPLEGNKSFLKQRVFQTIQEGIEAGYKPITTNPEELMQMYEQSVAKFEMAQKIKADLKTSGMWKIIQSGKPLPSGYAYIEDPIARAYFPQGTIQTSEGSKEHFAQVGRAAAPTSVARLINNHLSVDWLQKSPTVRTLMQAKNALNAIQLGFSGFHILFTTLDSIVTGLDVGLGYLSQGNLKMAAKAFAKAPFNAVNYFKDGQKFYNGDPELLKIEDDLFHGGASLKKHQYFKNSTLDNFLKNVREGNYPGALGRLPFAAIEGTMRPLFSYYIPRLKVGAFRDLFSEELSRRSKDIESGKVTRVALAKEVWGNIENRLGELNYDNLFWNRNFKAANMLMWRAVGWNLGTIREIGGATTQDFAKFVSDSMHGRKPNLTPKMRYVLALFFVLGTIGSIYEKLHTGHGPKNFKDMLYPENGGTDQNGDPIRVEFPSYLKDMYGYIHHPIQTVGNKLSPEISVLLQVIQNRDYYGNYVYDPKSGLPKELGDSLKYLVSQVKPFSLTNVLELEKGNASKEQEAESFLGIQKAPADQIQSERTKAIFDSLQEQGPKTPEEQKLAQLKNKYRKQIQDGKIPSFAELKSAGLVTNAVGYRDFIKNAKLTPSERAYKSLPKAKKANIPK